MDFHAALEFAQRLELGPRGGGIVYVLPPGVDTSLYGGIFFATPLTRSGRPLTVVEPPPEGEP
jgi:hypothetical protein